MLDEPMWEVSNYDENLNRHINSPERKVLLVEAIELDCMLRFSRVAGEIDRVVTSAVKGE